MELQYGNGPSICKRMKKSLNEEFDGTLL